MGKEIVKEILQPEQLYKRQLSAVTVRPGSKPVNELFGHETTLAPVSDPKTAVDLSDVMIDFTLPEATMNHLQICADHLKPIVIGTTGFSQSNLEVIKNTAKKIPVLLSGNMSLGVNVLAATVKKISDLLNSDWDAEVIETHHKQKIDAPSGTAKMLINAISGKNRSETVNHFSVGENRKSGQIGISVIRGGGVIGEHEVRFISNNEELCFSHRAFNRSLFAQGAVFAALKLSNMQPGFYDMQDILNIG